MATIYLGGHSSGSPRRRKGGSINGLFNKCRTLVRNSFPNWHRSDTDSEDRGVDKDKCSQEQHNYKFYGDGICSNLDVRRWPISNPNKHNCKQVELRNESYVTSLKEVA